MTLALGATLMSVSNCRLTIGKKYLCRPYYLCRERKVLPHRYAQPGTAGLFHSRIDRFGALDSAQRQFPATDSSER